MSFFIFFLAVALSIDSLVASISTGVCMQKIRIYDILKVAMFMAVFQGGLPVLGWLAGKEFTNLIANYAYWVASILFFIIGGKMIYEGVKNDEENCSCLCPSNTFMLSCIALATSIDAFVVGVGFGFLGNSIWIPSLIIGITTFLFSITGIFIGHHLGHKTNINLETVGGFVFIGLGIKILLSV